jgi:triosephosphate isomerase
MSRRPYVVGNWKMNLGRAEARALASAVAGGVGQFDRVDVGVAPSHVWLCDVASAVAGTGVRVLAQTAHEAASGAFTGEVSVRMVAESGATGVIIGHSERRTLFGETDAGVARKVVAARGAGLEVILCVGETLDQRDAGSTLEVVGRQVREGLASVTSLSGITLAYEPVWAIGTGRTATADQAQQVHAFVRGVLRERFGAEADATRIQYGGSVKPENAAELLGQPDVDGALVGGASLDAAGFARIVAAAR